MSGKEAAVAIQGAEHDGPVVVVGYSPTVLPALHSHLPENSLIIIDEPDVMRRHDAYKNTADMPVLRDLVEWELYELDGAADVFYNTHRELRPAAIVPISEYGVPFAARLAERYGAVGAGYGAARALRDKQLLRRVTEAAGIANPKSVVVTGPAEIKALMAATGGPVVIKPANRQASLGTKIVHEPADVEESWLDCLEQDEGNYATSRSMPLRMLAEQYISGDEFSVEMMLRAGVPEFGGVTRTLLFDGPRPVEQGHLHPADIPEALTERLLTDTVRVLEAVGMDSGFVHCEWRVERGVPYLLECAGRMPGGAIPKLIAVALGYNVFAAFYDMMRGKQVTARPPAKVPRYAASWMSAAPAGEIESVDGVEEAMLLPGVISCVALTEAGARSQGLRSSMDRAVEATARGATPAQALANAQAAVNRVSIKVSPHP
jgi:biotin carboxylase